MFILNILFILKDVNVTHLEQLSNNLAGMFNEREHDNILTVQVNKQAFLAHKSMLSSASSYLR